MKKRILISVCAMLMCAGSVSSQTTATPVKPISKIVYDGAYIQTPDLKYIGITEAVVRTNHLAQNAKRGTCMAHFAPNINYSVEPLNEASVKNVKYIVLKGVEFISNSQKVFISAVQGIQCYWVMDDNSIPACRGYAFRPKMQNIERDIIEVFDENEMMSIEQNCRSLSTLTIQKKADATNNTLTIALKDELVKNKLYVIWLNDNPTRFWFFKIVE